MSTPSCSECGGTRWVRYFSETTNGNLEEAFRLCPCNHERETRGERAHEESKRAEINAQELASLKSRTLNTNSLCRLVDELSLRSFVPFSEVTAKL